MKKNIFSLFTTILLISNPLFCQNYQWAKGFGDSSFDNAYSNVIDASGNIITTGHFSGTIDFDPGIGTYTVTSTGLAMNVFILKLDANGNFIWVKTFAGNGGAYGMDLILDPSGNIYITGSFTNIFDFDTGIGTYTLQSNGSTDMYVCKLDPNGNFIWAKSVGGSGNEEGNDITLDGFGNILITGVFNGSCDFDPGPTTYSLSSMGFDDFYISKLDANGNFIWANSIGSFGTEQSTSIVTDVNTNIYVTGSFDGGVDFDPGPSSYNLFTNGSRDIFISKFDFNGNFVWAKGIGGPGWDEGKSIALDVFGNIYTTGSFSQTVDFDPNSGVFNMTSAGKADVFISKLDQNGNFIWAKNLGGAGDDISNGVTTDFIGNVFTTGYHEGIADFDPNLGTYLLPSYGCSDIFVSKLDMIGNFIWAKNAGGSACEAGYVVSVSNNSIYVSGAFNSTCDFNPPLSSTITSNGWDDFFIMKYNNNSLEVNETKLEPISVFPNPNAGNELFIKRNLNFRINNVSIYSAIGSLVSSENIIDSGKEIISLKDLPEVSGIYFVKLYTNDKIYTYKLSIE